jgi:hypothetical protein
MIRGMESRLTAAELLKLAFSLQLNPNSDLNSGPTISAFRVQE